MLVPRKNLLTKFYDVLDFNICLNEIDLTVKKFKRRWNGDFVVVLELRKDVNKYGESEY